MNLLQKGSSNQIGKATRKQSNPHFRKYTGIENAKNYNNIFNEGDEIILHKNFMEQIGELDMFLLKLILFGKNLKDY